MEVVDGAPDPERGPKADPAGPGAVFAALAIAGAVALAWSRTFDVPWYLDDYGAIVENEGIRDLGRAAANLLGPRGLGFFSFALSFAVSGYSVAAWHLANTAIHAAAGVVAFLCLRRLLGRGGLVPLAGALVFSLHPLQTQAVTYVVQRFASLAGLLCLLALLLYLEWRERAVGRSARPALYGASLLAGVAALLSKENAAVLPALLALVELLVPARGGRPAPAWRRLLPVAPFAAAPALLAAKTLGLFAHGVAGTAAAASAPFEGDVVGASVTRLAYFSTELGVVWRYLVLTLVPARQVFDLGLGVDPAPFRPAAIAAGVGLVLLVLGAGALRRRLPLASLGILWFLAALSVESTFVPLDTCFEHRLYLPLFGAALVLVALLERFGPPDGRRLAAVVAAIGLVPGLLTLRRNEQWRDPVRLFRADLDHGSASYRSAAGLADALHARGESAEAGAVYGVFLERASERCRREACGPKYLLNMGVAAERLGDAARAAELYRAAIAAAPGYAVAHYDLGVLLYGAGRRPEALAAFREAARLAPGDTDALFNHASVALELGDPAPARAALPRLRTAAPKLASELEAGLAAAGQRAPGAGAEP